MAARSSDFLEVREEKVGRLRSRSGGYLDLFEEQERFERQKRDMAMKKYHDSRYSNIAQPADRLHVPVFENAGHRRVRSSENIVERKEEPARRSADAVPSYNVREQKPKFDLSGDAPLPSKLPVRTKPHRRPSIKVQIHQDDPPISVNSIRTPQRSPRVSPRVSPGVSPSASPRSPNAKPQLLYQFETLQNKLSQIEAACEPKSYVEAANPRDLTFSKISDEVKGFAFQLRVWSHIATVENLARIDSKKRKTVELAAHTMERLLERVSELSEACSKARPQDLKIAPLPEVDDDEGYEMYDDDDDDDDDDDERDAKDVFENLGFVIQSHLRGIEMNIKTLGRLTRTLQEASPAAMEEVEAVENLIDEVDNFFGSTEALNRHSTDPVFAGRKALEEARYTSGLRG